MGRLERGMTLDDMAEWGGLFDWGELMGECDGCSLRPIVVLHDFGPAFRVGMGRVDGVGLGLDLGGVFQARMRGEEFRGEGR